MLKEFELKTKFLADWDLLVSRFYQVYCEELVGVLAPCSIKSFCLNTSYLMIQNRSWVLYESFEELWIEYCSSEFNIDRKSSYSLLHKLLPLSNFNQLNEDNHEDSALFNLCLDYVFAENCDDFTLRNGFASNLFTLLQIAEKHLSDDDMPMVIDSNLRSKLQILLQEALSVKQEIPLSYSLYNLHTLLRTEANVFNFDLNNLERLLTVLGAVGSSGINRSQAKELEIIQDLSILVKSQTVYISKDRNDDIYNLSQKGISIVSGFLVQSSNIKSFGEILSHSDDIQTAFIKQYIGRPADLARQSILFFDRIGPRAIGALIKRLSTENPGSISDILQLLPYEKCSSWAKYEICQNLRLMPEQVDIRRAINRLLKNESSDRVRNSAHHTLSARGYYNF